jgi:hypothetical protein
MADGDQRRREDFVDEKTIGEFVGKVEPGDEVSLAVVLWSVGLSLVLLVATTIWWVTTH